MAVPTCVDQLAFHIQSASAGTRSSLLQVHHTSLVAKKPVTFQVFFAAEASCN